MPPSGRAPWLGWSLVAIIGLLVLLAGVATLWFGGPRFHGRTANHWFPSWEGSTEEWRESRLPDLVQGGVDVMPVLLASLAPVDPEAERRYDEFRNRASGVLKAWFPARMSREEIENRAREFLWQWLPHAGEPVVRAFTNVFDLLPAGLQMDGDYGLTLRTDVWPVVGAHLLRVTETSTNQAAITAGTALLGAKAATPAALERVLAGLGRVPGSVWDDERSRGPFDLVRAARGSLGRLTPAIPWLEGWWSTGGPPRKATAALLLPFLAPDRFPVRKTLEQALPDIGPQALHLLGHWAGIGGSAAAGTRREFLEVLAPILLGDEAEVWKARWSKHADPRVRIGAVSGRPWLPLVGFRMLEALGAEASPAAPYLPRWLGSGEAPEVYRAARTLARIGPVVPQLIPEILSGLTNEVSAGPLVLLLASYGPKATAALPLLRGLADGTARISSQPSLAKLSTFDRSELGVESPRVSASRAPDGFTTSKLSFHHACAANLGLTNAWPGVAAGAKEKDVRTLAELAAEALRRIGGGG